MATFEKAQAIVGISEGGYQNDPHDDGNWYNGQLIGTNWGISAPLLAKYLGHAPTKADMVTLPKATAVKILKAIFWDANNLNKLANQSIATLIYDGAVNQGTNGIRHVIENAFNSLRKYVRYYNATTVQTIRLMNSLNQQTLFNAIKTQRLNRYKATAKPEFMKGDIHRLDRIQFVEETGGATPLIASAIIAIGVSLIFLGL